MEEWPFELADGREVHDPVAWITVGLRGRRQPTIAVFGEPDTEPILGVVTLEEFRVAADPVRGRLVPVPGRWKELRVHTPNLDAPSELGAP